ncbi:glycosyltransferase family 4 protein [Mucilaginibacter xinganensis]|uniref:Mannosyltransferase n=1 Tax=Mucilaginibacter xinganensis TaxID=1234841 RepID=A0A223NVM7_9SPHI|nr:glycosyltransferase family 1 protein [Mucilaginibacter xinganensis]ASU33678.1 mannosyltransferase [Mucilaginibacter xinganensis]
MKIGYDAKRLFLNNTGLGNYSRWLVKNIAQHYPGNQYFLYTPRLKANNSLDFLHNAGQIKTVTPKSKLFTSWWRSRGIVKNLKQDGIEIYHGLSHELPAGIRQTGIKTIVTVHDLIFMRLPESFGWINRRIYTAKVVYACKVADKIIAISEKTKDDLVALLNVDTNKIEVIYQGIDPVFNNPQSKAQKEAVVTKYKLPAKFLLSVGTIETRKNLLLTVKALKLTDACMVVVGKPTAYLDDVKKYLSDNKLTQRVTFLHEVTFNELPAIYQLATVFVYPSRYEGFGLPVLEAISSGVPVIAATGSCLEEAGGPDSLYVDPDDENDLAQKINRIFADEKLRQAMIAAGKQYAAKFESDKLSAQLMQLYNNIKKC